MELYCSQRQFGYIYVLFILLTMRISDVFVSCQEGSGSGFYESTPEPVTTTIGTTTTNVSSSFTTDRTTTEYSTTVVPWINETTDRTTTEYSTTGVPWINETSTVEIHDITVTTAPIPTTPVTCEMTCFGDNQTCIEEICTLVCPKNCPENSTCKNAEKGCECNNGYEQLFEGSNCVDIDECDETCDAPNQDCVNYPGYYSCSCESGFYEQGGECLPQPKECESCGEHAACRDPDKGCECEPGWSKSSTDSNACPEDVDECSFGGVCASATELCQNIEGSYSCLCIDGYSRNDNVCEPEKCSADTVPCTLAPPELCADEETDVTFEETLFGYSTTSTNKCLPNTASAGKPYATRSCSIDGSWEAPRWLTSCGTSIEDLVEAPIETIEEQEEVSANLEVLTSEPEELEPENITSTVEVIEEVTATENITSSVATSVVSTISNVMESPNLEESQQSSELLAQLDEVASKVVFEEEGKPFIAVNNNISMLVAEGNTSNSTGIGVAVLTRPDSASLGFRADQFAAIDAPLGTGQTVNQNSVEATIYVPEMAINGSRVAIYVFGNTNLFPRNTNQSENSQGFVLEKYIVNSLVLSASIEGVNVTDLPEGNRLMYTIPVDESNVDTQGNPLCGYWNESINEWLTEGCSVNMTGTTNTSISCICDHLTNFATLLDISGDSYTTVVNALDVITIVGCSISSFALVLVIITFTFIPNTRRGRKFLPAFLLLNLSLALLGLNITLLVSEMPFITSPESYPGMKDSCIAIAAIIHFFLLGSCSWMNCEAVILLINITQPIYARSQMDHKKAASFASFYAWLFPIIFVGTVLAVNTSVYERAYEEDEKIICWIESDMVLYLVVIPLSILIGFNLIIYGILTIKMCRNNDRTWGPQWRSTRKSQQRNIVINVCIAVTVGLTWVFGFFVTAFSFSETTSIVFAYIFTVLNSLQGLFLFLIYVIRSRDVRRTIAKEFYRLSDPFTTLRKTNVGDTSGMKRSTNQGGTTDNPYKSENNTEEEILSHVVSKRDTNPEITHRRGITNRAYSGV